MKSLRYLTLTALCLITCCALYASGKTDRKCKKNSQPNILFFIVDEQRYPTEYESEELKAWKRENLKFQTMLGSIGSVFHNHYANTNACCPSRATIHTGQYPNVHGVTQTSGIAKEATDPDMTWLAPYTVPTIGNYLRQAGYKTVLKGKWHVSDAAIRLQDGSYMTTYDADGLPLEEFYQFYLEKNVLDPYGYDGWVGPEPHGSAPLNSGSSVVPPKLGRDVKYTQEVLNELDALKKKKKPWLLIASYADPHDIAVYGLYARLSHLMGTDWYFPVDPTLPEKLFTDKFALSLTESLADKPPAQESYRDLYSTALQPIVDIDRAQRFYYTIQKKADDNMMQVWNKLKSSPMYKNTIVVFTSDHGELLASHGGMFQKWHQAYQEAIHVPLIISSSLFGNKQRDIYDLTSHIDVLPTLVDFAKGDPDAIRHKLSKTFSLSLPLPGKSLSSMVKHNKRKKEPVYFYTEDDPTRGDNQINAECQSYDSVVQPSSVEAIVAFIDNSLWKLTHYYSIYGNCSNVDGPTYELYNITNDPMELDSLYDKPLYHDEQNYLLDLLEEHRVKYRTVQ